MNPQETEQVVARDEGWVHAAERVKISPTNVRLETTVKQKEETFQVVIDVIKNFTCFKVFTVSADVPEILMQQFRHTVTKVKGSNSYEFLLANKECVVNAEVFRKILDICPRKEGEDFTEVLNDDDTLTFLVGLGYSGPLHKYTNMFVDHMHQPWRTLATCINKCLSGNTANNDNLRKSRIDILLEKKSRRENMPYPRFTKVIIDYFLSKLKSLKKLKFQHLHTIKDDGVVSRLKFVRIGKAVQQYGLPIPATMLNIDIIESESYQRFLLNSTGLIPPKKNRGKGSQRKKTGDATQENVEVTEESDPEPLIRKKTSHSRVTKKEATISAADNIIPDPDLALELGKSISFTKADAREVHATHEKIVSEVVLELTRRRQTGVAISDTSSAVDIMEALKESRKTSRRQSGTGGSDEGTGEIPGVPDESIVVFSTSSEGTSTKPEVPDKEEIIYKEGADETREHSDRDADAKDDDEEIESDSEDIYKYKIKVRKDADVEMKDAKTVKEREELTDAKKTAELTKEITEQPLTSPSLFVSSDYGTQFINLSQDEETSEKPTVISTTSELQQITPIPTTIPTPPINTEAPSIPEITSLIAVQLRVTKLEQDVSELKKTDHSAAALASIQSQVPIIVDKYLGNKINDALLKALERHTTDLIEKYFRLPALESRKKKESKKSAEEIIIIKREQDEKKQMKTYTIKSTDKAALKEFNLKSALFKAMHENKSANRNLANYRLYHALIETLIEDENAMDKDVADTVKDHKRKHDSDNDDDDDDEGPSAGPNQVRHQRREEPESQKKPVKEPTKEVSMDEQPTEDILSPDDMHVSDPEDTDNAHIPKVPTTTTWFRPLPEEERPASREPKWVIPPSDLPEADNNWANALAKTYQDLDENKIHNKTRDIGLFIKWYCRRIRKDKLNKADFEGPTFMMVDLVNPEGHRIVPDISKPLPLGGPSGQVTIQPQFFFNKDLEYLLACDQERKTTLSIFKLKAAQYLDFWLEELVPSLWIESERRYDISAAHGITHWWFRRKEFYINNHRVSSDPHIVAVSSSLRSLKPKRTIESRAKRSSINLIRTHFLLLFFTHCGNKIIQRVLRIILVILPEHLSDANAFTMKMEIMLEPSSNKLLVGSYKDGVGDNIPAESRS
uniref:Uncharacterized protein n=1 Tax=Tanacetum cinerariifolium TaxID=118510 RepID=A0A6L2JAF4_TANCI|nr:hypothetical protein [Tanacetum cinerariifolium]